MEYPRIVIAAPKSGSGKTTVTCGLLAALKKMNIEACSFKCGPDYIDPMFHRNVLGIPSGNLDTFFTDKETVREIFVREYKGDIAVVEGVMGLYDGVGGIEIEGSTYDVAKALKSPIVLVVDVKGCGRSVLAQIKGFLDFDTEHLIKAVILNKTSKGYGNILKPLIEKELDIRCLGCIENREEVSFSTRHLGLVTPEEIPDIQDKLKELGEMTMEGIDIISLLALSWENALNSNLVEREYETVSEVKKAVPKVRVAIARDNAFCFYYRENLELLLSYGVEPVFFSPIKDKKLPENINGLILGGGYPENYLKELSGNSSMLLDIKEKLSDDLPVIAECGGFMYLTEGIRDKEGCFYPMVGFIKAKASWIGKTVRFGYAYLTDKDGNTIKGHEFHYFDTDNNGEAFMAVKPTGNRSWKCMHKIGASFMGFPHLYYPSNPE
ncbi:MAG: cobyrinate a,c-diamide synthase, partial [Butyrivibrio sp.]|nr:cobyrinate a,c-diamide synthase [Butyrivibrio sp.]